VRRSDAAVGFFLVDAQTGSINEREIE